MQRNDILKLLFETPYEALRERADEVRAREKGEHVFVRGLIEFSNRCERNCRYCGLRSANPPKGCKFHTRCRKCMEICKNQVPEVKDMGNGHKVRCHLYD